MLYKASDLKREFALADEANQESLALRHPFRRDYARLIHSPVFRRLQGKTQLFPGAESDFFRNRLTHSLEVAQIAKAIAIRINEGLLKDRPADSKLQLDLVEMAGLAHDLGHPPFGHIGEAALDECMKDDGGFEGNAQTLRILSRLEKKQDGPTPNRLGLNLTYRSLAAVLKYDNEIPLLSENREDRGSICKGYYKSEADLVKRIKASVIGDLSYEGQFKTVECQIMDFADDIAYSTYDLEDSLKAAFITPLEILRDCFYDGALMDRIAEKVSKNMDSHCDSGNVYEVLARLFFFDNQVSDIRRLMEQMEGKDSAGEKAAEVLQFAIERFEISQRIAKDGYYRNKLTSTLVDRFISAVQFDWNEKAPPFSVISMQSDVWRQMEVLKHYTFEKQIMSSRMKIVEYRGDEIVTDIFNSLDDPQGGALLLPDDFKSLIDPAANDSERKRVLCDFIAGMTDRYALEFYGRLTSETPQTIFKPY